MTPSLLQLLIDGGLLETSADVHVPSKILVGGEAIMPSLWKQLVETEKLIFITYTVLQNVRLMQRVIISKQIVRVTIGRPLPNVQTYVLDKICYLFQLV